MNSLKSNNKKSAKKILFKISFKIKCKHKFIPAILMQVKLIKIYT